MSARTKTPRNGKTGGAQPAWSFRVFVVERDAPHSARAIDQLRGTLDRHLLDGYHLEVIDLREKPELAAQEQLIVIPAVIRKRPGPEVRLTGSFADESRLVAAFGLGSATNTGLGGTGDSHG